MPLTLAGYIQTVEVDGTVYVGGGQSETHDHIVMAYNTRSSKWHYLPSYSTGYFSMAVVDHRLVLVGGFCKTDHYSRELGV